MPEVFDFAVVGSGFAGSIMSMVLRRLGYSVLLLERGTHPRFVIGESSTPFANLLLETLAEKFDLPMLRELSEWGRWQRSHPELPAGLKRGFTFYHHSAGAELDLANRETQLLVAASPNDEVADTHWHRPDFDQALVQEARRLGAHYFDRCGVRKVVRQGEGWEIGTERETFAARFVIDASGGASPLADWLGAKRGAFASMPPTRAVFAHFKNVPRTHEFVPGMPYPPDDAAVHHVFDGGWIWVLRFNNGITSAGAALRQGLFPGEPEKTWDAILDAFPTVGRMFRTATSVTPVYAIDPLSFRRDSAAGPRFALLPSAAAFVDPLLSTGFALSLLGILRLAEAFNAAGPDADLTEYSRQTLDEADAAADLVSALYAKMYRFDEFSRLTLLYFAALSYTETCWRLGKRGLASGFLLTNSAAFNRARRNLCARARAGKTIHAEAVRSAIAGIDVAGLTRDDRAGWHPVDLADLILSREKVGASMEDLRALFRKMNIEWPGP